MSFVRKGAGHMTDVRNSRADRCDRVEVLDRRVTVVSVTARCREELDPSNIVIWTSVNFESWPL